MTNAEIRSRKNLAGKTRNRGISMKEDAKKTRRRRQAGFFIFFASFFALSTPSRSHVFYSKWGVIAPGYLTPSLVGKPGAN
jgi:hypothetical protein